MKRSLKLLTVTLVTGLTVAVSGAIPSSADTSGPGSAWCTTHNNVAIIGTSADTGYGTTGYPTDAQTYQPTPYGWTFRFGQSLYGQWGTTVQNYAHNGALASDYLPGGRWSSTTGATADITTHQPDLVIIDLGGNEFYSQVPPTTFATDLTTVVNNVKAAQPDATILMSIYAQLLWTPNPYASTENYTWDQYATQIYNTAVNEGVALVDMRQYVPPAGIADLPNPSPWTSDNIHLNDAGNLAEYGAFWGWTSSIASTC
jgi:lysophospholipase L1-like esterase